MGQFTTAEEQALAEAYLQCDLAPAKRIDCALVIAGWPTIYTAVSTYTVGAGVHAISTNNGFTTAAQFAWMDFPKIAAQALKGEIPETGGYDAGKCEVVLQDKHGTSTTTRDLTDLLSRAARLEGNVTWTETTLNGALTKATTTVVLADGSGFSTGDTIWVNHEAILLGSKATHTFTGCTRGYLLTNATTHESGVKVYDEMPSLIGRPFWIYKGYQDLALTEWLPMWGGILTYADRGEPGTVKLAGRATTWEMWGGSAPGGARSDALFVRPGRTNTSPASGVRKIVRLGQIDDDHNDENATVGIVTSWLGGDYRIVFTVPFSTADAAALNDGSFALKYGDYWLGICQGSVSVVSGTSYPGTVVVANLVKGLVSGNAPDHLPDGATLDLAWTGATFREDAPADGADPIEMLLKLLTSTGAASNGSYDVYSKGIGLSISTEKIDTSTFTAIQARYDYDAETKVFFLFSEATPAKPFFDDELCKPFGWYLATGNDGRIKLIQPRNPTKFYFSRANWDFSIVHSNSSDTRHFLLPAGVYTPGEFATAIAAGLTAATGATFSCNWNDDVSHGFRLSVASGTFTFSASDAWNTVGFTSGSGGAVTECDSDTIGIFTSTDFNTITENDIHHMGGGHGDRPAPISRINFGCNYNWNDERFDYKVFVDAEHENLAPFGESRPFEINSKGLIRAFGQTGGRARSPFLALLPPSHAASCEGIPKDVSSSVGIDNSGSGAAVLASHLFDRYRNPPARITGLPLKWKFNTREVGDCVLLSHAVAARFVDTELASDSLSERVFEITSIQPDPKNGRVIVDLLGHRSSGATSSAAVAADTSTSPDELAGLLAWWKAEHIAGLVDGDNVATWEDSSGNGYTVTQATGGNRPVYKTNIVNGKPVVRFDGADNYLSKTMGASLFGPSDDFTMFFVYRVDDSSSRCLLSQDTGAGANPKWFVRHATPSGGADQMNWHINDGVTSEFAHSTSAFASAAFHIAILTKSGLNYVWYKDNVADATDTLTIGFPAQTADLRIGFGEGTDYFYGDIAEIGVVNRTLTAAERTALYTHLVEEYV